MPKKPTILVCVTCGASYKRINRKQQYCSVACFIRPPEVRLWSRVDISDQPDGCSEWQGNRDPLGYGRIEYRGRPVLVHRLAWELAYGPIPDGLFVLHRCDNPPCVRLDHLSLGNQTDNIHEAMARGRHIQGERVASAKLTDAKVLWLLAEYARGGVTQRALADTLGVKQSTIQAIVNGRRWKHLPRPH